MFPPLWRAISDYSLSAGVLAWLVGIALALGFAEVPRRSPRFKFWGAAVLAQAGCAASTAGELAEAHAPFQPGLSWTFPLHPWLSCFSILSALAVFPLPLSCRERSKLCRSALALVGISALIAVGWVGRVPLWFIALAMVGGLAVIAKSRGFERLAGVSASVTWAHRLLGALVMAAAWGGLASHVPGMPANRPDASAVGYLRLAHGVVFTAAAWGICVAQWSMFLREHALPRVRLRTRLLGLAPAGALPVMLVGVFTVGGGLVALLARQAHAEPWESIIRLQGLALVVCFGALAGSGLLYLVKKLNDTELRALKEQAEADSHAKSEFLAMVSHEVRTPLQSVLGFAELAAGEPLTPGAARHISAVLSQGGVLLRVVQDILDYRSLQSEELPIHRDAVVVAELMEDVRSAFQDRAAVKGLRLRVEIDGGMPRAIETDRGRLCQVLLNLVANAVKFTAHGEVAMAVRVVESARGREENFVVEWRVKDTGPGIPRQQLMRIFEPFRKLREVDTAGGTGGGVGLGLAICEQIVRRLGGTIGVESVYGHGATFRVRLPVRTATSEPALAEMEKRDRPAVPVHALGGLRVLLVDDNPYVREQLREAMRRLGAVVWARPDGRSAIEAMRMRTFDLLMLDLKLPDMDGCVLARTLRRLLKGSQKPWVIGTSAGISDKRLEAALASDLDEFLLKPIAIAGLAETIRLSPLGDRIVANRPSETDENGKLREDREGFFSEATAVLNRMDAILQEGQAERLAAEAHYLANGCLYHGYELAFSTCREIEEQAESANLEGVGHRISSLRVALSTPSMATRPELP